MLQASKYALFPSQLSEKIIMYKNEINTEE